MVDRTCPKVLMVMVLGFSVSARPARHTGTCGAVQSDGGERFDQAQDWTCFARRRARRNPDGGRPVTDKGVGLGGRMVQMVAGRRKWGDLGRAEGEEVSSDDLVETKYTKRQPRVWRRWDRMRISFDVHQR